MSIMEQPKPLPWYERWYYAIEPRFIRHIRFKIQARIMLKQFMRYGLPLIRSPFPTAKLEHLVSVQPMKDIPLSDVFYIDYRYGHPADKTAVIVVTKPEKKEDIVPPQFKPMENVPRLYETVSVVHASVECNKLNEEAGKEMWVAIDPMLQQYAGVVSGSL